MQTTFDTTKKQLLTLTAINSAGNMDTSTPLTTTNSNPSVASVVPVGTNGREFSVVAQAPGVTVVTFAYQTKQVDIEVTVTEFVDRTGLSVSFGAITAK